MKVVIVGNGIAGNEVAFLLRAQDPDIYITILSAEGCPEYDPCSLTYFVGEDVSREVIFRKTIEEYEKSNIRLVLNSRVTFIDEKNKQVITERGDQYPYDKLVLAHGGSSFVPPIEGVDKKGVFRCKQLPEADKLAEHDGTRAVVIGSGAVGIEVAEALKKKGYHVCIIELLDWILPILFDKPTARRLEADLEGYGISVLTGEKLLSIEGETSVSSVVTDKREILCDTVVIATGVVPGKALAETAGIEVDRGIKVDGMLETSVSGIFACGDCVETVDANTGEPCTYQLKHNALEQARVVSENILDKKTVYKGAYPFARAHFFNTHAVSFGKTEEGTVRAGFDPEVIERASGRDYLRVVLLDGKIIGGQAIGGFADDMGFLMGAMWRKEDIHALTDKWDRVSRAKSSLPWTDRKIADLIGLRA